MGTLCTSGAALVKAGIGLSVEWNLSGAATELKWDSVIPQAEGYLSTLVREDLVTNYASYDSNIKLILEEACSNLAAIYAIQWDMSGYTSRQEAESMINILFERVRQIVEILDDQKGVSFVKNG